VWSLSHEVTTKSHPQSIQDTAKLSKLHGQTIRSAEKKSKLISSKCIVVVAWNVLSGLHRRAFQAVSFAVGL